MNIEQESAVGADSPELLALVSTSAPNAEKAGISPRAGSHALLSKIEAVRTEYDKTALLNALRAPAKPTVVSFVNQHGFNLVWNDEDFRRSILASDVLLRDGVGLAVAMSILGHEAGLNLNGTDLIPQLIEAYAGRNVMLLGTRSPYLDCAANEIRAKGCHIVGIIDGYQDNQVYLDTVSRLRPDLVILGMGMPKQEMVADLLAKALDFPVLIINGGAILDFLANRFPRAPKWVRALRMEWCFRLMLEPRRLWRRYITGGVTFLVRVMHLRLSGPYRQGRDRDAGHASTMESASCAVRLDELAVEPMRKVQ
jgi:exopolysaccharide biosynthesis WecB/TagA/CpsF family protein